MTNIKLAVLGPHNRGRISLLAHRPEDGFHLVAACGDKLDNLDIYREKCGENLYFTTDYRKIVSDPDIDAVFVCTPDHLHFEHALAALEAGKPVFLEKPMATGIEDCDRILKASNQSGTKLYVGHNMRFFPVMQKMHDLIQDGRIGRVEAVWCRHFIGYGGDAYYKDWHSQRANTTGLLLQKGAHDIDIIHWLSGSYARRVVGMGKLSVYCDVTNRRSEDDIPETSFNQNNWPPLAQKGLSPQIDVEDHSMLMLRLSNGVQACYQQCHYTPDEQRNYTVIGTEGRIENFGDHSTPEHLAEVRLWNRRTGYSERGHEVFSIPLMEGSHGGSDPMMIDDFLGFLRGNRVTGASPLDARMAVAVGCLGTASLRNHSLTEEIPAWNA
jgi:predicted dehydrogenase